MGRCPAGAAVGVAETVANGRDDGRRGIVDLHKSRRKIEHDILKIKKNIPKTLSPVSVDKSVDKISLL